MLYKYINEGIVEPQPNSIVVGDYRIYNPTDETLKANGYKELIEVEQPSPYYNLSYSDGDVITQVWTEWSTEEKIQFYPTLVSEKIREQYSLDDELALLRQRDEKPDEFSAYNSFAELCKAQAKIELGLEDVTDD